MKLALYQMEAEAGNHSANLDRIADRARAAAVAGADCLLAPELAISGYGAGAVMTQEAGDLDGPQVARLKEISAETGLALVTGLALRIPGQDKACNSAVAVLPDGQVEPYNKIHLYGDYEKSHFDRGTDRPGLVEIAGLKVGVIVCFDVEFPEMVRGLALAGADVVLVPTALPATDHDDFISEKMIPTRAFESQVFVAYGNHAGGDSRFSYAGRSCIVGPDGQDLARAPATGEALLLADLDVTAYDACRAANPYLEECHL
ncbi:nitrilase-related carbon-nitrogen hydrolase [Rhodovibrionaceae bacterium A322]